MGPDEAVASASQAEAASPSNERCPTTDVLIKLSGRFTWRCRRCRTIQRTLSNSLATNRGHRSRWPTPMRGNARSAGSPATR